MKHKSLHEWGRGKARERYARGGSPSEDEIKKAFREDRRNKLHGTGADFDMTDSDTVDIDKANALADPEHKDRGGY